MPVFEYKCEDCLSVFEHFFSVSNSDVRCVFCKSSRVSRVMESNFFPKKLFCIHDKRGLNFIPKPFKNVTN